MNVDSHAKQITTALNDAESRTLQSASNAQTGSFLLQTSPSRQFAGLIIVVHGLALCAAMANALPFLFKLLLFLMVSISLQRMLYKYFISSDARQLNYSRQFGWRLGSGEQLRQVKIMPSTVITNLAIILHYKQQNGVKQTMLVFNDALNPEHYRKLKATLKISDHVD